MTWMIWGSREAPWLRKPRRRSSAQWGHQRNCDLWKSQYGNYTPTYRGAHIVPIKHGLLENRMFCFCRSNRDARTMPRSENFEGEFSHVWLVIRHDSTLRNRWFVCIPRLKRPQGQTNFGIRDLDREKENVIILSCVWFKLLHFRVIPIIVILCGININLFVISYFNVLHIILYQSNSIPLVFLIRTHVHHEDHVAYTLTTQHIMYILYTVYCIYRCL